jgi:hypothetical protein
VAGEHCEIMAHSPSMDEWQHAAGELVHLRGLVMNGTNLSDSAFMVAAPPNWCPLGGSSVMGMRVEPMLGITKPHLVVIAP